MQLYVSPYITNFKSLIFNCLKIIIFSYLYISWSFTTPEHYVF
jgi:hypothetical protein